MFHSVIVVAKWFKTFLSHSASAKVETGAKQAVLYSSHI